MALAMVAATAIMAAGIAVSRSSVFAARAIDVTGNAHLATAAILRAADLHRTTNAVWLDEDAAERRLEALTWVEEARVSVSLPWTVRVEVVERIPIGIVDDGEARALMAADGTSLGPVARLHGLPRIELALGASAPGTVRGRPRIETGPQVSAQWRTAAIAGAAVALGEMDDDLRARIGRVTVSPDGMIELRVEDGPLVRYGSPEHARRKASTLERVLRWSPDLARVSLIAPDVPAVTLAL